MTEIYIDKLPQQSLDLQTLPTISYPLKLQASPVSTAPDTNCDHQHWTELIPLANSNLSSATLTRQTYYIRQCSQLGVFFTFEPIVRGKICYLCQRIIEFIKCILKTFTRPLELLAQSVAPFRYVSSKWSAIYSGNNFHFEPKKKHLTSKQKTSNQHEWHQITSELLLVWYYIHGSQNSQEQHFDLVKESVRTFVFEDYDETIVSSKDFTAQKMTRITRKTQGPISFNEEATVRMLIDLNYLNQFFECQYVFLTDDYFKKEKNSGSLKELQERYNTLIQKFYSYLILNLLTSPKQYLILNLQDVHLTSIIHKFINGINRRVFEITWDGKPGKKPNNFSLNKAQQNHSKKLKFDSPITSYLPICENQLKESISANDTTPLTSLLNAALDQKQHQINQEQIHDEISKKITQIHNQIEKNVQAQLQKQEDTLQKCEQSYKDIHDQSMNLYYENDKCIKNTQKTVNLRRCWKEFMVQCKFRCKWGVKCPCHFNQCQLQIQQRYLERLFRYRDRILEIQNKSKNYQIRMENKNTENINTDANFSQRISPISSNSDIQPLKIVENGLTHSTPTDEGKKEEKRKKKLRSDHLPLRNHQSHMTKKNGIKNDKIKRQKCNYTQQQLNLHNLLDQLQLEGTYRAPCYVEESCINKWKEMSKSFKKSNIQLPKNQQTNTEKMKKH